jgi:hypothetical protein
LDGFRQMVPNVAVVVFGVVLSYRVNFVIAVVVAVVVTVPVVSVR